MNDTVSLNIVPNRFIYFNVKSVKSEEAHDFECWMKKDQRI